MLGQLGQALEAAGGVVAEQLAGPVDVDLGQRARAGRRRAAGSRAGRCRRARCMQLGGLGEAERVLAAEVVAAVPAHLREQLLQVLAQLVDLPAQVHVLEQLLGQALQLRPLLGRHRVEHRLHRRHALGHDLEQLVEVLRVLGEEVAVALHELVEVGAPRPRSRCSSISLSSASMSFIRCMSSGETLLHRAGHLVEVALHELLAQLVDELLELLARLAST